jgi:hypothetical protein
LSIREYLILKSFTLALLATLCYGVCDARAAESEATSPARFPSNKVVRVEYRGGSFVGGQTSFFLSANAIKAVTKSDIEAIAVAPKWDAIFINAHEKLLAEMPHALWQEAGFGNPYGYDNVVPSSMIQEQKATYLGLPVVVRSYRALRRDGALFKTRSAPEMCVLQRYENTSLPHLQEQLDFIGKFFGCSNLKGIPLISRYKTKKGEEYNLEAIMAELVPASSVTFKLSSTGFKRVSSPYQLMHSKYQPVLDVLEDQSSDGLTHTLSAPNRKTP